uniref:Uncharacterized protein n=1 Tax=Brassica campestris TaxID=3711 RepID=A0A3P5ZFL2_BRACM|nr:unnamed protein product [Brassica rapa]
MQLLLLRFKAPSSVPLLLLLHLMQLPLLRFKAPSIPHLMAHLLLW